MLNIFCFEVFFGQSINICYYSIFTLPWNLKIFVKCWRIDDNVHHKLVNLNFRNISETQQIKFVKIANLPSAEFPRN
ncbi:unnamed protein product [Rodentolepis nana]|uniref:Uncharacterized protein n=1 Tax=Rodentolepis nana TaxID=102285 RepID=A0A3P7SWH0_RODNA|nr:unnamed protein product [Rodentolepis nana]